MNWLNNKTLKKMAGIFTLGLVGAFATGCTEMSTGYVQGPNGQLLPYANYRSVNPDQAANVANSAVNMVRVLDGKRPVKFRPVYTPGNSVNMAPPPPPYPQSYQQPQRPISGPESERMRELMGEGLWYGN